MPPFVVGHATHPDWRMALSLAAAQVGAQLAQGKGAPTLGFAYFTDHFAAHAEGLLAALRQRWSDVGWVGCVGVGVAASGVEYFDEPALVLMLAQLPREHFEVFSGAHPLARIDAFSALVHADPSTPDLAELLVEMSQRTRSGYLFGGVAASRNGMRHFADGVWQGGLSGVAFTQDVALLSRVTQGCQPIGPVRDVTAAERNEVQSLDGEPALRCLLRDLDATLDEPRTLLPKLRATLVGLSDATEAMFARDAMFGTDTRVRHLIGVDPGRQAFAIADAVRPGMRLAFCSRNAVAARRDLVRICSEIREELSPDTGADGVRPVAGAGPVTSWSASTPDALRADLRAAMPDHAARATRRRKPRTADVPQSAAQRIAGAIYVSCSGRGGPHFGAPSAELQIIKHALGEVPLVGFFAAGEIARHHLYGYTGVLTVFARS
jgi:small ligand-binding sensory domain FIST